MSALMTVPFHGANLMLIEHEGQPYVPMKSIVSGIGLDWGGQQSKLSKNADRWRYRLIPIPSQGGMQEAGCLPLRKLPGWLQSVSAAKVSPDVRERLVEYQDECDEVLWKYWNDGHADNPRAAQQAPAKEASAEALVELAKLTLEHLPNLGESSKQALLSAVTEKALGHKVIPLPKVEEHLMPATEVGEKLGISKAMVGRLANANGLKVPEYGEFRLDKASHSSKQVETFHYNAAGLERLREILAEKSAA